MARHRSSAAPLAWLYAALIVYASLYPFGPWRMPGVSPVAFLALPWPQYSTGFDLGANFIGYIPLGALVFGAVVRGGGRDGVGLAIAVGVGAGLSLAVEGLQNFLPQRVASNVDLGLNALGALTGAALGWAIHVSGGVELWQAARDRWFIGRSAGGLALLLLWPLGLLYPLPVPLGQGQVLTKIQEALAELTAGTPAAGWFEVWLEAEAERAVLSGGAEFAIVALGLMAPCLVAFSIAQPGWRRVALVAGATLTGMLATTLSTALNFGPQHLLAWSTPHVLTSLGVGAALALLASLAPARAAVGLGLMVLTALVTLVSQAPADPYFAESLHAWEQGRFIRFHGAALWVGWLWPYAAICYLLARLGARDEPPKIPP